MSTTATRFVEPKQRRWTRDEFYRLLDMGFFLEQRVELIEGEIIEMASQKNFHAAGISLVDDAMRTAFGPGHWIRVQMTLDLTPWSAPDPDIAVIPGDPRHPDKLNPTTALLIVEVSETTLAYDRVKKGSLYAVAGIADYWILNLVDRRLEVFRNPQPDTTKLYGFGYADVDSFDSSERVSPLAAPNAEILVADLLP